MHPEHLRLIRTAARPDLHPDGRRVVFDVTSIDPEEDRSERQVWMWDGDRARPFSGGQGDTQPKWSPDGSKLAFLRAIEGDKPQLAVMPADGGEAITITSFDLGVAGFEWSPSSEKIAVVGLSWTEEWAGLDDDERKRKPRRIRAAAYRWDNRGWLHNRLAQVWLADPTSSSDPERLTSEDRNETSPAWSPDGSRIALLTPSDPARMMSPGSDIVEVTVADRSERLRHREGGWVAVSYDPAGELRAVGEEEARAWPSLASLWALGENGNARNLTASLDRSIWSFLLPPEMAEPVPVGSGYLIGLEDRGRVHVVMLDPSGDTSPVIAGDRYVTGFDAPADGSMVVFTATDPSQPAELFASVNGEARQLTNLNDSFVREASPIAPDHFVVESGGGEIDVWVVAPSGTEDLPVLVNIHGGPASQYGFTFFDEFQVYASAGYGVVACNPRGSSGRGLEFVRAVTAEGWGIVDVEDVTAALDGALRRYPRFDPDRVGIMGGSYGGFLTAWMLTQTDRFRSAVVERALLSWESFSGTSDIAPNFSRAYLHAVPPGGRERLAAASPLTFADQITTPTLIIHSENDYRCPIEQAEQLFMTLLRTGTEVEMLRFPGEGHELSRSGTPRHRIERFEAILEWHDRHLKN